MWDKMVSPCGRVRIGFILSCWLWPLLDAYTPALRSVWPTGLSNTWDYSGSPYCRNVQHVLLIVSQTSGACPQYLRITTRWQILWRQEKQGPVLASSGHLVRGGRITQIMYLSKSKVKTTAQKYRATSKCIEIKYKCEDISIKISNQICSVVS